MNIRAPDDASHASRSAVQRTSGRGVAAVAAVAALVIIALVALLAGLAAGGGASRAPSLDPGAFVRWGLPISTLVVNLSAAGTIGSLVLVCIAFSPTKPEFGRALDVAAASAAIMTLASAATGFLTYLDVLGGKTVFDDSFTQGLVDFAVGTGSGQAWLATTSIAAVTTVLCFAVRSPTGLVFVTGLAMFVLLPMALNGYADGAVGRDRAVVAVGLYLLFAAIWIGALLAIVLLAPTFGEDRLIVMLERYSRLAIVCFVVVAFSGIVSGVLRVGAWRDLLTTAYGALVLVQVVVLVVLGASSVWLRRAVTGRMHAGTGQGALWWTVATGLPLMGIASGVAVALARTAAPVASASSSHPTPAEVLTGRPLPGPLTAESALLGVNVDPFWLLGCAFAIVVYLAAVVRLGRRDEVWPKARTGSWVVGVVLLSWITNGGIGAYERYLFSAHLALLALLAMVVPLLLVPAAPVTLALRMLRPRHDGSRGAREWLLRVVRSRAAAFLTHPITAAVLYAGALWVFCLTPLFRWAVAGPIGHESMSLLLLVTGGLFVQSMIGIDPAKRRFARALRLVVLLCVMLFCVLLGLLIMTSSGLFLADWYGAMGRTWGLTPLADQYVGGAFALAVGVLSTAILGGLTAVRWRRDRAEHPR